MAVSSFYPYSQRQFWQNFCFWCLFLLIKRRKRVGLSALAWVLFPTSCGGQVHRDKTEALSRAVLLAEVMVTSHARQECICLLLWDIGWKPTRPWVQSSSLCSSEPSSSQCLAGADGCLCEGTLIRLLVNMEQTRSPGTTVTISPCFHSVASFCIEFDCGCQKPPASPFSLLPPISHMSCPLPPSPRPEPISERCPPSSHIRLDLAVLMF